MLFFIRSLSFLCQKSPDWLLRTYCFLLGTVLYYALPAKRRDLLSHLAHVYPERSMAELKKLGRINCRRTIEMGLLALISPRYDAKSIAQHLTIHTDNIEKISSNALRKPLIILLPHSYLLELFSCVPILCGLRPEMVGAIFRPMDHPKLDAWIRETRERWGCKLYSRKEEIHRATKLLQSGGLLAILADQHAGASGIMGHFAGRIASFSPLPDLLESKVDGIIAFAYIKRTGFLQGEFHFDLALDGNGTATQKFGAWWEHKLWTEPGMDCDWLWLHRRWKMRERPRERLNLNPKRSWPEGPIPISGDRTHSERIDLRLPDNGEDLASILPLVTEIRNARPDARLTAVCSEKTAERLKEYGSPVDAVFILTNNYFHDCKKLWQKRIQFTDTTFHFTHSTCAELQTWLSGSRQRFGVASSKWKCPFLTHYWNPKTKKSLLVTSPGDYWTSYLTHFGLPPDTLEKQGFRSHLSTRKNQK